MGVGRGLLVLTSSDLRPVPTPAFCPVDSPSLCCQSKRGRRWQLGSWACLSSALPRPLLASYSPFPQAVELPDSFSPELRSLLEGLLQRDVHRRLGCQGRG